jgi:hypothetical protein
LTTDLDEAVRSFPISSWLSGYTRVRDNGGRNIYADCPVCQGKLKLRIKRDGKWNCFKCPKTGQTDWKGWGNLVNLVSHLEQLQWRDTLSFIADKAGLPDIVIARADKPRSRLPREAIPLTEAERDHPAVVNLYRRKLEHLIDRIYICVSGKYADRWILPCYFRGELHGFEAKSYWGKEPKCLYPEWFMTSESIYTTKEWDDSCPAAVITESVFDAETFGQNAVGIYGSNFTPGQLDCLLKLRESGVRNLYWALDPDASVRQAAAILQQASAFFTNYVVPLPEFTPEAKKADPNELGHDACIELLGKAQLISSELDLLERELANL